MLVRIRRVATWAVGLVAFAGCEQKPQLDGEILPIADAASSADATGTAPKQVQLAYIATRDDYRNYRLWEQVAREQAGMLQATYQAYHPEPNDPPNAQAGLIRKAIDEKATVLVVIPEASPEVGPALTAARDAGATVILMDRPALGLTDPFPLVATPDVAVQAKLVVEAAIADLKRLKYEVGEAVLIVDRAEDDFGKETRVAALRKAAEVVGLKLGDDVEINKPGGPKPGDQFLDFMKAHPKTTLVLFENDAGMSAGIEVKEKLDLQGTYVVAGMGARSASSQMTQYGMVAAISVLDSGIVMRKAVKAAMELSKGRKPVDRIEPEWVFSTGKSTPAKAKYKDAVGDPRSKIQRNDPIVPD